MPSVASEVGATAASHTAYRAHKGAARSDHDPASPFAMLLDTGSSMDASAKIATDSQSARPARSVQADGGASSDHRSTDPTPPATDTGQPPQATNGLADNSDRIAGGQVASGEVAANTISTSPDGKVTKAIADGITTARGSTEDRHSADKLAPPDGGDALAAGATPSPNSSPPPDVAPTIAAVVAVPAVIDASSGQPSGAAAGVQAAAPTGPTAPSVVPDPAQQSGQQAPQPLSAKPLGQTPAVPDIPPAAGAVGAADQPPPTAKSDTPQKTDGTHPASVDTVTTAPQSTGVAATQPADDATGSDADGHDDVKGSTPHAVAGNGLEEATEPTKAIHRQPKAEPTAEQNEAATARAPTAADSLQPVDLQSVRIRADTAIPAAQTATVASSTAASVAVPVNGLAVEIAAHAQNGQNRFEIRLDPPELGRIEVRLDVDRDGNVSTRVMVERADTLDVLRREAPQLQQALDQAGLKTGSNGLQFSLRDQSFASTGHNNRDNALPNVARIIVPEDDMAAVEATRGYSRWAGLGGGVDIRV